MNRIRAAEHPTARILIVDDEAANVRLLERVLTLGGYVAVTATTDPRQVMDLFAEVSPDLVLLDLHMPHVDGFVLIKQISEATSPDDFLPILMLTGDVTDEARERALSTGAMDFLTKPLHAPEVTLRVHNLLATRFLHKRLQDQNENLEKMVERRTRELENARFEVLERLTHAAEFRDHDTGEHTRRVGEDAASIAHILGVGEAQTELIRRAAPLHDIGKIAIPDAILLKPGRLTSKEFEVMKTHTTLGASILTNGKSDLIRLAEQIALGHHERWDGKGYPRNIGGEDIHIAARIVSLADFYDALSHARPYRPAWDQQDIWAEIERERGRHFDPLVVEAFREVKLGTRTVQRPAADRPLPHRE